jgi:hypothetical protein
VLLRNESEQRCTAGVQALPALQASTVGALGEARTVTIGNLPKLFHAHSLLE